MPSQSARSSGKRRDYDAESGVRRVSKKKEKKVIVEPSESDDESESEPEIKIARKKIVKKSFKEDARRKTYQNPTSSEEEEADAPAVRTKTTKQSGTADKDSAASSGTPVAPWISMLMAFDLFGISIPRYTQTSFFAPSAFALFNILYAMETSLNGNTRINNYSTSYISLGPRIYYAFLFYYQILRAQFAAGIPLDAVYRRCLRKLETILPLESCVVAGPLIPFFQTLGSYKPSDNMYSWIVPSIPAFTTGSTVHDGPDETMLNMPFIPAMVGFLRSLSLISSTRMGQTFENPQGFIIPVARPTPPAAVNWSVFNLNWQTDGTTVMGTALESAFATPGLSFALVEHASTTLTSSRTREWSRYGLPPVAGNLVIDDLERLLLITGATNTDWIKSLRDMAVAQAHFFKGSVNLSNISPTTSAAVTVIGIYETPAAPPTALVPLSQVNSGYNSIARSYSCLSGTVADNEFKIGSLMSIICGVDNADAWTPPTGWNMHPITSVSGPYFREDAGNGNFTGALRSRWRKETSSEENVDFDIRSLVHQHMYSAMGEEPEPVRIVS